MMAAMEPLLYAASVDLVIAGHVHAYERSVCLYGLAFYPLCKHHLVGTGF